MTRIHRSEFVRQLRAAVPEVESYLKGYRDNLTMEMEAFLVFTRDAIQKRRLKLVKKSFEFAAHALADGNSAVQNAIAVSYLEHLEFSGDEGKAAFILLPENLRTEWFEIHKYMHDLVGKPLPVVGEPPSNKGRTR